MKTRFTLGVLITLLAMVLGLTTASAHDPTLGVVPAVVTETIAPGNSIDVPKTVHTLAIPPLVDICLVEDETGSFADDIANLQALVGPGGSLIAALDATGSDYATCVVGYRDFAQDGWGDPGDWVYRRLADVTVGGGGFALGVPLLTAGGGGDLPEAQLEALDYLADPLHAAIDSNGDADTVDANDTVAGLQPTWRLGSTRVALLATDADCHITGDSGGWPGDGGTTSAAVTAGILNSAGITVIGLTPGGAGDIGCVDTLAAGTGGSIHPTTATGETIGDAILAGLGNLPVTVTPQIGTCDASLLVTFDQPGQIVISGEDASFLETITVSAAAPQGQTLLCTVTWLVDGVNPGPEFVEQISITVPDVTPPVAACPEGVNPSGKNVPQAPGKGQNEDGFYELTASDNVDSDPEIFVGDTGSSFIAGPFPSGTNIKLVQAPGADPGVKPGPNEVDWMITLNGDAIVYAVDASGNVSDTASCLVPPPPK